MRQGRRQAPFWVGGMAAAGVVVAHTLTYLFAAPHGPHRASLLRETGHTAWPFVSAVGLGCLIAALVHFALTRPSSARSPRWSSVGARILVLQTAGWLLLETSERTLAAHEPAEVLRDPVVAMGLGVQVVVALAGTLFLRVFGRVIDAVSRSRTRVRWDRAVVVPRPPLALHRPRIRPAAGGAGLRGPPASL